MGAEISKPGRYYVDVSGAWTRLSVDFDANGLFWAVECDVDWRPIDGGRVYNVADLAGCRWERVVCDGGSASLVGSGDAHPDGRSVVDNDCDSQPEPGMNANRFLNPIASNSDAKSVAYGIANDPINASCWRGFIRQCVTETLHSLSDGPAAAFNNRDLGEAVGNRFLRYMKLLAGGPKANCTTPLEVR